MKHYKIVLQLHLAAYARNQLGITERGTWRGTHYNHILPASQHTLNFLGHCRSDILAYLGGNPKIKLHKYFHHLSSSQAFAFNLFFPFFSHGVPAARSFFEAFGPIIPHQWWFEYLPDREEGTNVDVAWKNRHGATVYCEVKLSESGFGTARDDAKHRKKLDTIYRERLGPLVSAELLEPRVFFSNYQFLRNISLLHRNSQDMVVFLYPRENVSLSQQLDRVILGVRPAVRSRIQLVALELLLQGLVSDSSLSMQLRSHAVAVAQKYLPSV